MLDDRSYMRQRRRPANYDNGDGRKTLLTLIIINVIVFLLFSSAGAVDAFALTTRGIRELRLYQLVTAMFMHAGFSHLFFNMFSLYIFGSLSAPVLGQKHFLGLYFFSGILGNLLWIISAFSDNNPGILVGASGAIMGVIMATAMLMPDIEMYLLFIPFSFKLKTLAMVFIAIEFFNQLTVAGHSNIAYLVHLGGFVGGYLYMILFLRHYVQWNPLKKFFGTHSNTNRSPFENFSRKMPKGWSFGSPSDSGKSTHASTGNNRVTQRELDYLLDKISRDGINSLSEAEMQRLEQAREQMMRGKN